MISVLLPTRKRLPTLRRSVGSLLATRIRCDVETMLYVDEDDGETLAGLQQEPVPGTKLVVGPRVGYLRMHEMVNALCERSTGDWLFLWNDDALMRTQGWDLVVDGHRGRLVVLNPQTNHGNHALANCIFPIVPRRMYEAMGHFSLSNHNDTYAEWVANQLGIRVDVPIFVLHDRADLTGANRDGVFMEREFTTAEFYGEANMSKIRTDVETLRPLVEAGATMAFEGGNR